MWKIYKLFLVLLPGEKVYWAGINALKLAQYKIPIKTRIVVYK
jgi:ribosomal protein L16/L10AE